MLREKVSQYLGDQKKLEIKAKYSKLKKGFATTFLSYDGEKLKKKLLSMGIKETDTLFMHSNFKQDSGFKGTPNDIVNAMVDLLGTKGNLLMVSIPFRGRAYDYLMRNKTFRVNKTLSMMGLITEAFRRREGVLRSFHPTHPVLVYGKDSEWLAKGHEKCVFPCGIGTPFDKFRQLNGKLLFFDVRFTSITFFHYIEDILKDKLPFDVYDEKLFTVTAYDQFNQPKTIKTYAFSRQARNADKIRAEMSKRNMIKEGKVGNSNMILVNAENVVSCFIDMVESGNLPYDL